MRSTHGSYIPPTELTKTLMVESYTNKKGFNSFFQGQKFFWFLKNFFYNLLNPVMNNLKEEMEKVLPLYYSPNSFL